MRCLLVKNYLVIRKVTLCQVFRQFLFYMVQLALNRMPAEILLPLRDRHHLCRTRVPTDDLPHSAVAIVFRHPRVKLRPAKREADPPKAERIAAATPHRVTALPQGDYASLTAAAAVSDDPWAMGALAVLPWE